MRKRSIRHWFGILGLFLAVLTAAGSVQAGSLTGARISRIDHFSAGTVVVLFNMSRSPATACAAQQNNFAFSAASDAGRAFLSTITAAMLAGKTVNATGLGTCAVVTNFETLSGITVID